MSGIAISCNNQESSKENSEKENSEKEEEEEEMISANEDLKREYGLGGNFR
ncbi:hypothetical protein [Zunongwangia sp. H14]|uniref:hypothetical protein n=1 Tax=Zunongwangia sp. H14 TaxID=3240792 RepID=UPI00356A485A